MTCSVFLIVVLVLRLSITDSSDIFVSKLNGNDHKNCGHQVILPCRSLQYVLENKISKLKIVIRLDGGNDVVNPYKYLINKTFLLEREITITNTGNVRPTVSVYKKLKPSYELQHTVFHCKQECILTIYGIRFYDAPLVSIVSNITVQVKQCLVESSLRFLRTLMNEIQKNIAVEIFNSTFVDSTLAFDETKYLKINIINTTIHEHTRDFSLLSIHGAYVCDIQIRDSLFRNNGGVAISCIPSASNSKKIWIINTKFINTKKNGNALELLYCSSIYIKHSEFNGYIATALKIENALSVTVTRSSFTSNTGYNGGALYLRGSKCLISKCYFFNNTATNGGAIYYVMGMLYLLIANSRFISNSAIMLGGSLYTGKQQIKAEVKMRNVTFLVEPKFPSSAGIIIYSTVETSLLNVCMKIASTLFDWPIADGFSCDKGCIRKKRSASDFFKFKCPENHNAVAIFVKDKEENWISNLRCVRCRKDTYSINNGSIEIKYKHENLTALNLNAKCQRCPSGAICDNGVVSRGNFWGYLSSDKSDIIFIPCPSSYCCSSYGTKCTSYNTCNINRYGVLCGSCKSGSRVNYFDGRCITKRSCWKHLFWVLYLLYIIIYSVLFLYYKDIFLFVLKYIRGVKSKPDTTGDLMQPLIENSEGCVSQKDEENDNINHSTNVLSLRPRYSNMSRNIAGVTTIVFFFYQIERLLRIKQHDQRKSDILSEFRKAITSALNFEFISTKFLNICARENLTTIGKEFIQTAAFPTAITLLFTLHFCSKRCFFMWTRHEPYFQIKIRSCLIQLALLGYTGISSFCIKMMNCVNINDTHYLYIQGDVVCYSWWQYLIMVFFCIWIVPFPFTTYMSVKMLEKGKVSVTQFYICFSFPPYASYQYILKRKTGFDFDATEIPDNKKEKDSILELFTKPYRKSTSEESVINWEVVVLIRRLILSALCICIINPVFRMLTTFPTLLVFLLHHWYKSPFHSNALNRMETLSLSILLLLNIFDLIWALDYMHDLSRLPGFDLINLVFIWVKNIALSLPPLVVLIILSYVAVKKIIWRIRKCIRKVKWSEMCSC
ncbi:uncharacterized protein LOC130648940 [Hydractinia symbiolongicarpus]|uniref:uncharacterized protein LOC130648940 n=1 Tax=Hydractinia symbiolongicarpus TaxID=13093 RepID=UPI00254A1A98|nr:uncharacterized protein LOC130648940 [Hydractinia symbiolongicarpus]